MIEKEIDITTNHCFDDVELCRRHARFYAKLADIALGQITLDEYAEVRLSQNPQNTPLVSDQKLLFSILNPEQQLAFRDTFENIDFDN